MLYAGWTLWPSSEPIPYPVASRLVPDWATEARWGWVLFVLGFLQWWHADLRGSKRRYLVAATLWVVLVYVFGVYLWVGEAGRRLIPVMLTVALAQFWIAWRAHHDRKTRWPAGLERRRRV